MTQNSILPQLVPGIPPVGEPWEDHEGNRSRWTSRRVDMFKMELDAFSAAVLAGREPEVSGYDGLRAQEIVLAVQASALSPDQSRLLQRDPGPDSGQQRKPNEDRK